MTKQIKIPAIVTNDINNAIAQNARVSDRAAALEAKGYKVNRVPMGSGGVGQTKVMSDHIRIQIGYGTGRHNYAQAVILPLPSEGLPCGCDRPGDCLECQ